MQPTRLPLAEIALCSCFNLRKAARATTQLYDAILRPTGLRVTQFSLLSVVATAGAIGITALAEAAVMDRTTLTRNLDLLERDGLIRIQPGRDARVREVTLTPAAHEKLAEAVPYWREAQAQLHEALGAGRVSRLLADLSRTVAAAQPE
ncbi:MAG TPA: MarR family winged helix-turn-helix transcriptional regulator [Gemmatimonadaceae bacterium]|jgi:DNA-binding MarR family transcriptional regulator|nr:MarR family winged helix-turn-helix transcriptional regulator [Gemmatimonadaceae bacterium]